jgi:hypothetical protein
MMKRGFAVRKPKKILLLSLLLLGGMLCFSLSASAQLTLDSYSPPATEIPTGSHYYIINDPIAHGAVALTWNFSKGLDGYFTSNISSITVKEKDSSTKIGFDTSAGTQTSPAPGYETDTGSLLIENADFIYLKAGKKPNPELRQLQLKPTTVAFQAGKTYVVTIDNATFQANNGNILDFKYAFEFRTETPPSTSSTSTTTSVAGTSTTTSIDNATSTTTTINSTCIFVQAMGRKHAEELQAYRTLRDTRLLWSVRGFLYVLLYYFHAPELSRIFNEHPDLQLRFRQLSLSAAPQMEQALRNGQHIPLSLAQYQETLLLLEDTASHASPLLQRTIAGIYGTIKEGVIQRAFGIVVTED